MHIPKYKAWLKHEQIIRSVEAIDFVHGFIEVDRRKEFSNSFLYVFDEIELLPYTGVRDRHGVEIYQQDIIRIRTDTIQPQGLNYVVEWTEHNSSFRARTTGTSIELFSRSTENYEVLGNTYLNPELIGGFA